MTNPVIYSSPRQYIGVGVETVQGTAVVPAVTIPVNNFDPFDQPTWIDDNALRGSVTGPFNRVAGPNHSEFDMGGPLYFDTAGYLFANIFGDVTYAGTYSGSGTTTLASSASAGDTSISVDDSIASGTVIQISTDNSSEVRTTTGVTGSGPYTVTFTDALDRAHATSQVVRPIVTPYQQTYAVLNSGNAQPSSLTITDYQGPAGSSGMRAYAGCCLSELSLSGTVESSAITYTAKGMGWPSATAATFASAPSSVVPQAAWETKVGLNGTVSGSQIKTVNEFAFTFTRVLQVYDTAQNTQNPYFIVRGILTVSGTANIVVADETYLSYLTGNTQPQAQFLISNGLSGDDLLSLQIDAQQCAFNTSKISRGNPAVEAQITFDFIANTTNAGFSGGFSPCLITAQNAVPANGF